MATPVAALRWLETAAGQAELRTRALAAVEGLLEGRLEARVVRLDGQRVHLEGVRLLTPEGELVAEVATVDATLRLLELARSRVSLEAVRVGAPRLYLRQDERGLNLTRAVRPRVQAGGPPSPWRVSVADLVLESGFAELRAGSTHAVVDGVRVTGGAEVALASLGVTGALEASGQLRAPLLAPVTLSARADASSGATLGTAQLTLKDCSLRARGDLGRGELWAEQLVLAPETMRALVPGWPLRVPLTGQGRGSSDRAHLSLQAGPARLEAEGALTLSPLGSRLHPLTLTLPGASLTVEGTASAAGLDLSGQLQAADLSGLRPALRAVTELELPALVGHGQLQVQLRGPPARLSGTLGGQLADVGVRGLSARSLDLQLEVLDLARPLELQARLQALALSVGEQTLDGARLVVGVRGRELEADLATVGLGEAALHLAGTLDADDAGGTLRALRLTAAGAAWSLEAPARLAWGVGHASAEPLALQDGAQRVSVQWRADGARVVGQLHLQDLDLARLPRVLSPPSLGLAGRASLDVAVDGTWPWPDATLGLAWTGGALAGVTSLEVTAHAAWRRQRLLGTLRATSAQGAAEADFDLPLLATGPEPVSATARVSGLDPAQLAAPLGVALPVEGLFGLEVRAGGTAGAPALEAVLSAPTLVALVADVRLDVQAPRLEVETGDGGRLTARASGQVLDGGATVVLDTPFTLAGLRAHLPRAAELWHAPATLSLDARGLDLERLDRLGLVDLQGLTGRLSATASLTGRAAAPEGTVSLSLRQVALPTLTPLDAVATVTAAPGRTALALEVRLLDRPALTATASLAAEVSELMHPGSLGGRASTATVTVSPTDLSALLVPRPGEPVPSGALTGTLTLTGTLGAPALRLEAALEPEAQPPAAAGAVAATGATRSPRLVLGPAHLELTGDGQVQRVTLTLATPGAEGLAVEGTAGLPLAWPRALEGAAWLGAPLRLSLQAEGLDLRFLSGLHPLVRVVEGQLAARGALAGTLGAPTFLGEAHWSRGRLAFLGFGEYHQVEVDLRATESLVALDRLELLAGGGSAALTGALERAGPGRYQLTGEGTLDRLPLVADDQLLATASTSFELTGVLSPGLIDLTSLTATRVDVELPDVKRRDLQDLQRPADIVVLGRGSRAARKRLEALRAAGRAVTLRARLDAPRNLWLRGTDLDLELGLSEGFRVELGDELQVFGEAAILGGKVSVIGRGFEVQPGAKVRFAGPAALPFVDVAATYTNQKEQVKVTVAVDGRGAGVVLRTSSEPPMLEADIYTLLATGRRELRRGSGAVLTAEDAVSVLGQLAASQLRTVLSRGLPIDVLNFESSDNFANLKFDVGKYLSDWLYLGVSAQSGANPLHGENPWAGRLELRLSRRWSLEAYGGTAPAAGADVVWSNDF